jgi:hypothetical protein
VRELNHPPRKWIAVAISLLSGLIHPFIGVLASTVFAFAYRGDRRFRWLLILIGLAWLLFASYTMGYTGDGAGREL